MCVITIWIASLFLCQSKKAVKDPITGNMKRSVMEKTTLKHVYIKESSYW